jgi:hypothetical protein
MANVFKNAVSASVGTSAVDVYTAPSSTTSTVIGCTVSNRTGSLINIDAQITDTSGSATVYLVKAAPIATGSSLVLIGGDQKVVLETTDKLTITSDTATSADVIVSVLESS